MRVLLLLCLLISELSAQKSAPELGAEDLAFAEQSLISALAGPREEAFLQVLVTASVVRDSSIDTAFVYDIAVRFDPDRYQNPGVGMYPMNFTDQFIFWGKRISIFTRSTEWLSGRFFLHDISRGQHAWAYTDDLRRLYDQPQVRLPLATRDKPDTLPKWLKIIRNADSGTDVRTMGRWVRMIRFESLDEVLNKP